KVRRTAQKFPILWARRRDLARSGGDEGAENGEAAPGDETLPATMTAPGREPRSTAPAAKELVPQSRSGELRRSGIPRTRPVPSGGARAVRPGRFGPGETGLILIPASSSRYNP